ncbi:ParB/RepB/Spo0J family partition protein [Qingshengfaniella alkalisoli]|uniref:Chromosome partitioning protein n=1 Tax=Qingshengfaniella alkalisoli TaxID=2599296 RepID=A0A5B8IZM5_9RHOB|nr:ParB N-terminal domain-containing protein [Qingshengfaniella alkalisoli]QDY70401.1 chromosome partitioning protein [Qingshengfaniella alkalisoli]
MARRRLTPAQPGYLSPSQTPDNGGRRLNLSVPPIAQVASEAAGVSALREMADGIEAARQEGRMIVEVPLGKIAADHLLRDRVTLDQDEFDTLKASIRKHGQRTPAEITPLPDSDAPFGLISGWRRLRALTALHAETGEDRFATLRALIRPAEEAADSYVAMVEENEIRVGLSYYERARVAYEAARRGVFEDQGAALRGLFGTASRAKRSKIGSFMQLHEELGHVVRFPADIPERLGLALVSRLRFGDRHRIAEALKEADPQTAEDEIALLAKLADPPRQKPSVSRAKQPAEKLGKDLSLNAVRKGRTITLTLTGQNVDDALLAQAQDLLRRLKA